MIPEIRKKYNDNFTQKAYEDFLNHINTEFNHKAKFRVAETPVFIPKSLKNKIADANNELIEFLIRKDFKEITKNAVPKNLNVPNEDDKSLFIAIDYGICEDENGELVPRLIEIQGFPTLYSWENFLGLAYRKYFDIPENFSCFFSDMNPEKYLKILGESLLGKHSPENVILLEIEPENQGTSIDFYITEKYFGIKPVCITKIIREGRKLFYMKDDTKIPVYRIYNRVIFDEFLKRKDLKCQFNLTEEVDVEWAGHPNWFFRISKYTIPFMKSKYIPESRFLSDVKEIPSDLENYVLKPLFSFSGEGVIFNVKPEDITKITDKENYMLQRKVKYASAVQSPDGGVKAEIRILFLWNGEMPKPLPMISLLRLSKGDLIGVKYNKDKTWVGGSIAYFEQ